MNSKLIITTSLILIFMLASSANATIIPFPEPPENVSGILETRVTYESGYLRIKLINPSFPDVDTNSYMYIPTYFDGEPNLMVQLGNGFKQTGPAQIYQDWVGDHFEETAGKVMAWGKIIQMAAMIGTWDFSYAAVMVSESTSDPYKIIDLYSKITHELRTEALRYFMDIIYNYNAPQYDLPVNSSEPHWLLPPSSGLLIKVPVDVVSGDRTVKIGLNYYYLDTLATTPLAEWNYMGSKSSDVDGGRSPTLNYEQIGMFTPPIQVDIGIFAEIESAITNIGQQIMSFFISAFNSIVIHIRWEGSDLDLVVIDPNGNIYEGVQIDPVTETITINNPIPGEWRFIIKPVDVSPEGENYTLTIYTLEEEAEIPEIEITKSIEQKPCMSFKPRVKTNITATSDTPVSIINLTESIPNGWRVMRPWMSLTLHTENQAIPIDKNNYTISIEKDRISLSIDLKNSIESDNDTLYLLRKGQTLEFEYNLIKNRIKRLGFYPINTSITITSPYGDVSKRVISADIEILSLRERIRNCIKSFRKSGN